MMESSASPGDWTGELATNAAGGPVPTFAWAECSSMEPAVCNPLAPKNGANLSHSDKFVDAKPLWAALYRFFHLIERIEASQLRSGHWQAAMSKCETWISGCNCKHNN